MDHAAYAVVVGLGLRGTRRVRQEGRMARLLLLNGQAVRQRCHVGLLGLPDGVLARLSRFLAQLCAQLTINPAVRIWVLRVNNPVRYSSTSSRHATVLL